MSAARGTLVVASPVPAHPLGAGRHSLSRKFLTGMQAYASRWPGRVVAAVRGIAEPDTTLDQTEFKESDWGFGLQVVPSDGADFEARLAGADVVLVGQDPWSRRWTEACRARGVAFVPVIEWNADTRRRILWAESPGFLRGLKRLVWAERDARRFKTTAAAAAGLQCNGTPAFEEFGPLHPRSVLFFDSRIAADQVVGEAALGVRLSGLLSGRPLRLAFSGRFVEIKGVDHLPRVAAALVRAGLDFTMDLCGSGPLESSVREEAARLGVDGRFRLRGTLDFERELLPFMAREVDLFVCCHNQGDPSCTYLETLACGVPIAGYGNDAWRGLSQKCAAGWVQTPFHPEGLAKVIAGLDRAALAESSRRARAFALDHVFEKTMDRRVEHLEACAGGRT